MLFSKTKPAIALLIPIAFSCVQDHLMPEDTKLPNLETCDAVLPKGRLVYNQIQQVFDYTTSGGSIIKVNENTITNTFSGTATVQYWGNVANNGFNGGLYENLNGKHIKNRFGTIRTFIFPDGAKITYRTSGLDGVITSVSIYDGDQVHHINATCGKYTLVYSAVDQRITTLLDQAQADGETSTLEITQTGLLYVTIYTEDQPGNKIMNRVELGSLVNGKPNQVNDLFDDPRLGHT